MWLETKDAVTRTKNLVLKCVKLTTFGVVHLPALLAEESWDFPHFALRLQWRLKECLDNCMWQKITGIIWVLV